jgi:hypothetical protein
MKFGLRTPSLKKRIAARTSPARAIRHRLGLKAPGDIPKTKGWSLGARMEASRKPASSITWVNFDLVDEGRSVRNKLAYEAILPNREDCLKYIDAIGDEYRAWKIIK